MGRTCSRNGENRNPCGLLVGKPRRWVDNIKMDLKEIGKGGMYSIDVAQDRIQCRALVNTVKNLWVP
jgi:hypothetical protein